MAEKYTFIIPETLAGDRLDQALAKLMHPHSRTEIKEWIESGHILVDEHSAKPKLKLIGGENISVTTPERAPSSWEAQAIPLDIVYEDEALIIINKAVGMVVHPGAGNADQTLLNALLHHDPQLQTLPRAGILHRLDKDTSGLMLIAKTPTALKHLSLQLKNRRITREYQAIVYGLIISGSTINAAIDRHPIHRKRMAVMDNGKEAITHYRVMEKYHGITRLRVRLETGRTHQIRVHLAHIRHPIVGDATYALRIPLEKGMSPEALTALRQFKRQALHAFALGFMHPVTNEPMHFEVDIPDDMQQLIAALRARK